MPIDLSKLENVQKLQGKTQARCPACAEEGHDKNGEHLVIYESGAFACVKHNGDSEHVKAILRLAGTKNAKRRRGPSPVPVYRPAYATRAPRLKETVDWLLPAKAPVHETKTLEPIGKNVAQPDGWGEVTSPESTERWHRFRKKGAIMNVKETPAWLPSQIRAREEQVFVYEGVSMRLPVS